MQPARRRLHFSFNICVLPSVEVIGIWDLLPCSLLLFGCLSLLGAFLLDPEGFFDCGYQVLLSRLKGLYVDDTPFIFLCSAKWVGFEYRVFSEQFIQCDCYCLLCLREADSWRSRVRAIAIWFFHNGMLVRNWTLDLSLQVSGWCFGSCGFAAQTAGWSVSIQLEVMHSFSSRLIYCIISLTSWTCIWLLDSSAFFLARGALHCSILFQFSSCDIDVDRIKIILVLIVELVQQMDIFGQHLFGMLQLDTDLGRPGGDTLVLGNNLVHWFLDASEQPIEYIPSFIG